MKHKLSPKSDSSKFLLEHPQSVAFRQLRSTLQVRSILLILVITNIACRPLRTKQELGKICTHNLYPEGKQIFEPRLIGSQN